MSAQKKSVTKDHKQCDFTYTISDKQIHGRLITEKKTV